MVVIEFGSQLIIRLCPTHVRANKFYYLLALLVLTVRDAAK